MPDKNDITEGLDLIKLLLNFVQENSEFLKDISDAKHFDEEQMVYREMHEKIGEKFNSCTEDNEFHEIDSIMNEVCQLQKALIESELLDRFSKIKELRQVISAKKLSRQTIADLHRIINDATQIGESKSNISDTVTEEEKVSFKSTTDDLAQMNQPTEQTQRDSNSAVELEQQINVVADAAADERKQMEKYIYMQEQEIQSVVLKRLYERNTNKRISKTIDFHFIINLNDSKYMNLLKELNIAKLRLPNLRAVRIGHVSNANKDLIGFLDECTPAQLKLLRFNYFSYSPIATKAKFYMRSLPKLVSATTEEVYLRCLEFSEAEFEQIVRASCNAERLIFEDCEFHCSTALDFGSALKYKIKTLSFQSCKYTSSPKRRADWISAPVCFCNIVKGVSKSRLRDSLQTISIYKNLSLSAEKLQQMLNHKKMSHITVNEEYLKIKHY